MKNKRHFSFLFVFSLFLFLILFIIILGLPFLFDYLYGYFPYNQLICTICDWLKFGGTYYGGIFGAFLLGLFAFSSVIHYINLTRKNDWKREDERKLLEYRPFFSVEVLNNTYLDGYEFYYLISDNHSDYRKIMQIEVFYPTDDISILEFKERADVITKLVTLKQEKNELELQKSINDVRIPEYYNDSNQNDPIEDYQKRISQLYIDAYKYNRDKYKSIFLKLENVGGNIAQNVTFINEIDSKVRIDCICTGEDASLLKYIKVNKEITIRFSLKADKLLDDIKVMIVYNDLLGNTYRQDLTIKKTNPLEIAVNEPIQIEK